MSITVELELPEEIALEAKAQGLLEPDRISELIYQELKAPSTFQDITKKLHQLAGEPMTSVEIQEEIQQYRRKE